MTKKEAAILLGGSTVCQLTFGDLALKPDENGGYPIVTQGVGESAIIDFLVRISSSGDPVLQELLIMIPSIFSIRKFLDRMPIAEVTESQFESLVKHKEVI